MNRPEPIELENNLGPDSVTGEINRVPWMAYDVDEMDIYIAEKDKEIESLKASHYAEMVDAGMRERRLRRALWLARANSADGQFFYWCYRLAMESGFTKTDIRGYSINTKRKLRRTIREWIETWKNVKIKCLKKAEGYK